MPNNIDIILKQNFIQMKQWSQYKDSYKSYQKDKIRNILSIISGNDMINMLKDILNEDEKDQISENLIKSIQNLSFIYGAKKPIKKYMIAKSLRDANLTINKCKLLGYNFSKKLWNKCKNEVVEKRMGNNKRISNEIKTAIINHLENISSPSANRSLKQKNSEDRINVRYLNCTFKEAFRSFEYKNNLSFASFLKLMPKEYKKPFRLTDLCNYCEYKRGLILKLKRYANEFNYQQNIQFSETSIENIDEFLGFITNNEIFSENLKVEITELVHNYKLLDFHRKLANTQREAYNAMKKNKDILRDSILIDFDFKQKVFIGLSPRQINEEFYEQKQRCLFGVGIHYLDKNDKIRLLNVDIVYDGSQEAVSVVRCFRFLRAQSFFKEIEKSSYILWCDTGKHFRCTELANYFLDELAKEKINVNWNFFCEKHGKNSRDQHFSTVTTYIKQHEFKNKLVCTNDIVEAINQGQMRSNNHKLSKEDDIIDVIALEFNDDNLRNKIKKKVKQCFLNLPNIESFYNYRTIGESFKIVTSYTSNNEFLIDIDGIIISCENNKFYRSENDPVFTEEISLNSIISKKKNLNNLIQQLSNLKHEASHFLKEFFIEYLDE